MPDKKRNLTLTVDAETVEAAHKLGLNISELTEQLLRGYTFDSEGLERGATRDQYVNLLRTMDPLLAKYKCDVMVGECSLDPTDNEADWVYYSGNGKFHRETELDEYPSGSQVIVKEPVNPQGFVFLRPDRILKNFLQAVEKAKTQRQEEVEGLVMAMKIIEVLSDRESLAKAVQTVSEAESAANHVASQVKIPKRRRSHARVRAPSKVRRANLRAVK